MSTENATDERIAAAALAEIESPRLAVTSQFFEVHRPADQEPVACVWPQPGGWWVHVRLRDEPYFWVVKVEETPDGLEATWGYSSAYANVYLALYSDTVSPDEITGALGLTPSEARKKGEPVGARGARASGEHRWYYRSQCPEALDFETQLTHLLEEVSSRAEELHALRDEVRGVVQVGYYDYAECPTGWHLDADTVAKLSSLGLELDVDLYVSGPELPV